MKKLVFIVSLVAGMLLMSPHIMGQVTVGSGTPPAPHSLLQIKDKDPVNPTINNETSTTGGLVLPRVSLVNLNTLEPFVANTDTANIADYKKFKLLHTGMIVYNLSVGSGFTQGVFQWDGNKWKPTGSGQLQSEIIISPDASVNVFGSYYVGSSLNSTNYLTIKVDVVEPGTYSLVAQSGNGYYFQASGTFPSAGTYTVKLSGIGVPSIVQTDNLTITNNSEILKDAAGVVVNGSVTVSSATVNFNIMCTGATIVGSPLEAGVTLDDTEGVQIPITVESDGIAMFSTGTNNGVYYAVDQPVNTNTSSIILKAYGLPSKPGLYSYNFITNGANPTMCNFSVSVKSTLGTKENPAKSCLAILQDDPTSADGVYWVAPSAPVRTFCDMKNGGYTLIYSYSEHSLYGVSNTQFNNLHNNQVFTQNNPLGVAAAQDEMSAMPYELFRLPLTTMRSISANGNTKNMYRFRIVQDAANLENNNDYWANNNYFVIDFRTSTADFLNAVFSGATNININGKLFTKDMSIIYSASPRGNNFKFDQSNWFTADLGYGLWGATNAMVISYNAGAAASSNQPNTVFTYKVKKTDGTFYSPDPSNNIRDFNDIGNPYIGEAIQINHHIGRCGTDDYSTSTPTCANTWGTRTPHNFNMNNGKYQGRYVQWFVK